MTNTKFERKLQNFIFPKTKICTEEGLYFRRTGNCHYLWANDHIVFGDGVNHFATDTYFNFFSLEKWRKYTTVDSINLNIEIQGKFIVTIAREYKTGRGNEVLTEFLKEELYETRNRAFIKISLPITQESGSIYFSLCSLSKNSFLYGGYYSTEISDVSQINKIKIGLAICTFKREKFILQSLAAITSAFFDDGNEMKEHLEVFVSDNAHTILNESHHSNIHVFANKNAGGAGGFTRALIEIWQRRETDGFTHLIFMDDDVVFDPEVLFRTYSLLSLLKPKYKDAYVGGTMLRLDNQYLIHESGGFWSAGKTTSLKKGLDCRIAEACLYNEYEEKANYNAWWYCAMPLSVVNENNLPLPIFIKGDDIEYGIRNCKYLILMNGICVWHEPFENKYSSMQCYYFLRNQCIVNSIHKLVKKKQFFEEFRGSVLHEILWYRYKNAELIMRGVTDFMRGVDWLKSQDGEKLNKEILKDGYKMEYIDDLDAQFSYPEFERSCKLQDKNKLAKLRRLLSINGLLLKTNKKISYAPTEGARPIQYYRVKKVVNYDVFLHKGFVTERCRKTSFHLLFKYKILEIKCKFKIGRVIKEYNKRANELTSLTYWEKYLELGVKQNKK